MNETHANRLKRLTLRSKRRGLKEMDLLLGAWAEAHLGDLPDDQLALYEALLEENDQDLLAWALRHSAPPERFSGLIERIVAFSPAHLNERGII